MSRCTEKSNKFISEIINAIDNNSYRLRKIEVYYDAGKWSKKDYVADITIYRNSRWNSENTKWLKEVMRNAGATGIIGCVRHAIARDYLDLAFDIKKSKMKELGIDIPKVV